MKNYQLLVLAQTDAEKRAAVETTPARKLREIRMALTLDKTFTKPEILTRYLNLVSFGNGAFGIQDAAQTYFGIDASALNWQQSALLAGLVQSTSTLNPYTNPDGALARRNLVLDTMIENLPDRADELRAAKQEPLGILPQPNELPRGCIAAGDRAFFCDYVQEYLARAGLSKDQIAKGGYLIKTTLDPDVQGSVKSAVDSLAPPDINGIASVMSVILPGKTAHPVVAMVSNRTYGLDTAAGETVQPQPFSLVGDGAGSIFKIFTTAAAMDMGLGIGANLDAPVRFEAKGLGSGGARGCPSNTWVCAERGQLPRLDERHRCAGAVTEHRLRQAHLAGGVQRTVDMAVKLGLRSYAEPGTARPYDPETNESLADYIKRYNLGSFTLGPIEVNALELSNVAATLASGGMWCPPNPIDKVYDRLGNEVAVTTETCDQVVPEGLANTLSNALSKDDTNGTAANSAGSVGWGLPMSGKTGTTEAHRSSGFLGYTNRYAAASYIYDDSPTRPTCARGRCASAVTATSTGQRARQDLVQRDETDRRELRRRHHAADRPALRRRRPWLASAQRVRVEPGQRPRTDQGIRLPGGRSGQPDQQRVALRDGGGHLAGRADGAGVDHHDPDQQRHSARTATATAGRPAAAPRTASRRLRVRRSSRSRACRRSPSRCWRLRRRRSCHGSDTTVARLRARDGSTLPCRRPPRLPP